MVCCGKAVRLPSGLMAKRRRQPAECCSGGPASTAQARARRTRATRCPRPPACRTREGAGPPASRRTVRRTCGASVSGGPGTSGGERRERRQRQTRCVPVPRGARPDPHHAARPALPNGGRPASEPFPPKHLAAQKVRSFRTDDKAAQPFRQVAGSVRAVVYSGYGHPLSRHPLHTASTCTNTRAAGPRTPPPLPGWLYAQERIRTIRGM